MFNECEVLKSLYGVVLGCMNKFCGKIRSYRENGCLIAHTILALKEFDLIKEEVTNIIVNSLVKLLRNEPRYRRMEVVDLRRNDIKRYLIKLMEMTIVFHDLGKMAEGYLTNRRGFRHEIPSWIYMLFVKDIFNRLLKMKENFSWLVSSYKLYEQAALAVLLHHESMIWASVEWYEYLGDIIYEVINRLYRYSKRFDYLLLNTEMLNAFLYGLKHASNLGLLSNEIIITLEELIKRNEVLKKTINKLIPRYSAILNSNRSLSSNRLTFLMYYTLFIVDNRAALCRENTNNYWRIKYEKVIKELKERGDYELLVNTLKTELKNDIAFYATLSLIPKTLAQGEVLYRNDHH